MENFDANPDFSGFDVVAIPTELKANEDASNKRDEAIRRSFKKCVVCLNEENPTKYVFKFCRHQCLCERCFSIQASKKSEFIVGSETKSQFSLVL